MFYLLIQIFILIIIMLNHLILQFNLLLNQILILNLKYNYSLLNIYSSIVKSSLYLKKRNIVQHI